MKVEGKLSEDENADTTSSEGLIEEDEEDQDVKNTGVHKDDFDLLDVAFLRDGISLEPLNDDSEGDSDGLYDFKDTLGEQQFPIDLDSTKNLSQYPKQSKPSEWMYGKRYTARCIRRVHPSQLVPLMSLEIPPPPSVLTASSKRISDDETELSKLAQKLSWTPRRRRESPDLSRRRKSPLNRRPRRSRSPARMPQTRERLHRSPTGIERYRYWTGREYRSRNRSCDRRRSRRQ